MSEKVSDEELYNRVSACPADGRLYRHYKTRAVYEVVGSAICEANQEALVIYRSLARPYSFARPLKEWNELVLHDGVMVERFAAYEEE